MRLLAAGLLIFASVARAEEAPTSAEVVLGQMEQAYAALQSYSDSGTVNFRKPDGSEGAQVEFKIWFARPQFFRIDATTRSAAETAPLREVMWFDGEMARMWSTTTPVITRSKIQLAGSKMFGTYAYHIPTLLEPSYAGPKRLNQIESAILAEDETIDGVACDHLRGEWQHDPYELWLGKADHLVRKLVANYSGYIMEETHRALKLNDRIEPAVFRFAPEDEIAPHPKATPPPPLPGEHRKP